MKQLQHDTHDGIGVVDAGAVTDEELDYFKQII